MSKTLFLDLEDTIITPVVNGWFSADLMNVGKIKSFIEREGIEDFMIFSFAIWNDKDLEDFNRICRPMIEKSLGVNFGFIPTLEKDILDSCCKQKGISSSEISTMEVRDFWGKDLSFVLCAKDWFSKNESHHTVILLDDMVQTMSVTFKKENLTVQLFNIEDV